MDFEDVQFDSTVITSLKSVAIPSTTGIAVSSFRSDGNAWAMFWRRQGTLMEYGVNHATETIDWERVTKQCIAAVRPSCHSDLIAFLYSRGQYACVTRCAAMGLFMESLLAIAPPRQQVQDALSRNYMELASYFTQCHSKSVHAISHFQSHLRDICNVSYHTSDRENCDDTLQQELQRCVEALLSIPSPPHLQGEGGFPYVIVDITSSDDDKYFSQETREDIHKGIVEWVRNSWTGRTEYFEEEALLCFGEALIKLSYSGSFRVLYRRLLQEMSVTGQHPIDALISGYPDLLLHLYTLYHQSNSLRLLDRARAVLPSVCGDSLALRSCYCTIDSIQATKNFLFAEMGDWVLSPVLVNELDVEWAAVWHSVFKFALHSTLLDEALSAVIELIKLSRIASQAASVRTSDMIRTAYMQHDDDNWKGSLQALIMKACSTGHLGWLCALPETIGGGEENPAVDLTAEICSEMEFLAMSSDLADMGSLSAHAVITTSDSANPDAVSIYEYLAAFLLSKGDFSECARVLYRFYGRLVAEGPSSLGCLSVQVR